MSSSGTRCLVNFNVRLFYYTSSRSNQLLQRTPQLWGITTRVASPLRRLRDLQIPTSWNSDRLANYWFAGKNDGFVLSIGLAEGAHLFDADTGSLLYAIHDALPRSMNPIAWNRCSPSLMFVRREGWEGKMDIWRPPLPNSFPSLLSGPELGQVTGDQKLTDAYAVSYDITAVSS
jgi:hypothetical protein